MIYILDSSAVSREQSITYSNDNQRKRTNLLQVSDTPGNTKYMSKFGNRV